MEALARPEGRGATVGVVSLGPADEELLCLFEQVAREEGWQPEGQLRAEHPSAFLIGAYAGGELAGGLQVVLPGPSGRLPCLSVWPEAALPAGTAHCTVLAVRKEHRGRPALFWSLCAEAWRLCVEAGVGHLSLEATPGMLARYRRVGWPLEVVGEPRTHWGEECFLCLVDLRTLAGAMLTRALRSASYRELVLRAVRPRDGVCAVPAALA